MSYSPRPQETAPGPTHLNYGGTDGRTMERTCEIQAEWHRCAVEASSSLTTACHSWWMTPDTPQTHPRGPHGLAAKCSLHPRMLRLLRSSEAKSIGLHLLNTRARAPAGQSVPAGHRACAAPSGALGTCALLTAPERTQHSPRPPPQVTGAPSSFHPCPPPGEPAPLPHPLPGDSLELVTVSPLPKFRPAAPGGERQSHMSLL